MMKQIFNYSNNIFILNNLEYKQPNQKQILLQKKKKLVNLTVVINNNLMINITRVSKKV